MLDLICGALSSGAWGAAVKPLFGPRDEPYNCSHFYLAIDVAHFREVSGFENEVAAAAEGIRSSKRAPGVERLYSPGEGSWSRKQAGSGEINVPFRVVESLKTISSSLGLDSSDF